VLRNEAFRLWELSAGYESFSAQLRCGVDTGANINIFSWFVARQNFEYVTAVS
jgi:hypothetical protein